MPLLVLFSKCLHLLFVQNDSDKKFAISGVPIMANVMYLAEGTLLEDSSRPYFFGATMPAEPHQSTRDEHFKNSRGLVSTWRRNSLVDYALHAHQQSLPRLDPSILKALGVRLDAIIRGHPKATDDTQRLPLHSNVYEYSQSIRWRVIKRASTSNTAASSTFASSSNTAVVVPAYLLRDRRTKVTLQLLLNQMVTFLYSDNYDRQNPHVDRAFRQLLRFYVCPHVYSEGRQTVQIATIGMEVALNAQENSAVDSRVYSLWQSVSHAAFDKLEYLKKMQEEHEVPSASIVFGRYAETYPAVVLQ
jgi:hypothetical protein